MLLLLKSCLPRQPCAWCILSKTQILWKKQRLRLWFKVHRYALVHAHLAACAHAPSLQRQTCEHFGHGIPAGFCNVKGISSSPHHLAAQWLPIRRASGTGTAWAPRWCPTTAGNQQKYSRMPPLVQQLFPVQRKMKRDAPASLRGVCW